MKSQTEGLNYPLTFPPRKTRTLTILHVIGEIKQAGRVYWPAIIRCDNDQADFWLIPPGALVQLIEWIAGLDRPVKLSALNGTRWRIQYVNYHGMFENRWIIKMLPQFIEAK